MDQLIKKLISEIIIENGEVINIALKSRNKFEGWLKFEVASKLEKEGFRDVFVKTPMKDERIDMTYLSLMIMIFIALN